MNNHFHLVLETPRANLVAGMRWFLGTYTARFNRRHKYFGHLFSGRYKSLIVDGSVTVNLPASPSYSYDANGNLLSDGTRNFAYDCENELTAVWVANTWSNNFVYDGLLRKRIEKDYSWNGSSWLETNEIRYVYDGYLVVQERNAGNLPQVTYTRGNDLSGSLQGAGGIGGLLARTQNPSTLDPRLSSSATAYYFNDAQGNVVAMVDTNGNFAAQYEYDPFGNMISMSGPLASANHYRFSSKEWEDGPGLYYYGFRFYDPNLQRWPNRDPLSDWGGLAYLGPSLNQGANSGGGAMSHDEFVGLVAQINLNPFGAMNNDPVNFLDPNGESCGAAVRAGGWAARLAGLGASATAVAEALEPVGWAALGIEAVMVLSTPTPGAPPTDPTAYNPQGNYQNTPPSGLTLPMAQRPGSTMPLKGGPPNGSLAEDQGNGEGTIREYGPDGRAKTDYDFGHDHGDGDPHAHDWDWSNPNNPGRPSRPLCPGE